MPRPPPTLEVPLRPSAVRLVECCEKFPKGFRPYSRKQIAQPFADVRAKSVNSPQLFRNLQYVSGRESNPSLPL